MDIKKLTYYICVATFVMVAAAIPGKVMGCTSAIVSAERAVDGRWILWKHRDTGHLDNFVARVAPSAKPASPASTSNLFGIG